MVLQREKLGMFKFWYEKFLFRFSFVFAFCAFLGVFVYAYFTEVTMRLPGSSAPFSETLIHAGANTIIPDQRSLPLEKPHRTNKELQNWVSQAVSESLSFDKENFSQISNNVRQYYTNSGFKQYQGYLNSAGIIDSIRKNNYRMSVFVEEQPLMVNGVAMEDVYRWLYQLPVTVSFLPRNTNTLVGRGSNLLNRSFNLRLQIRRVKLPEDPNAIQIESWTVTGRR